MTKTTKKTFDFKLFKRLVRYAGAYKNRLVFVCIAAILLSVFAALRPYFLKEVIDQGIALKSYDKLQLYTLLMATMLFGEVLFQFLFVYNANWMGQQVIKDIRVQLFDHILRFKMNYFNNTPVGQLVTRNVSDIQKIADIFSQGLFTILADVLKMGVVISLMLYQSWQLTLIVLGVMPIILYATRVFQKKMKTAFEEVRAQVSNLNTFVQERVTGMKIVQIFSREAIEHKKFKAINAKHMNAWNKTVWYNSIFFPIAEMCTSMAIGLVVWYGGLQAATENSGITVGTVTGFIVYIGLLFTPLRQIADKFNTLLMGMVAASRVFNLIDKEASITNTGTKTLSNVKGQIIFKDVRFSYIKNEEILKGINLTINQGQTIAIVGATGAGKSTIINLLNRFYELNSGSICIDNTPITDINLKSLRAQIAVVLQDVFLFADSILNNITLKNPNITEQDVIKAAKSIGVHDFIKSLPNGYHYNVKERGAMLSSGQRQLISFLRAYVSNPAILVLDEATSSIDGHSELLIQQAIDHITQGRTAIVIAHRLATIKKADKIIVMEKGTIVEQGTHQELLKVEGGYYRHLYEVQFSSTNVA